MKNKLYITIGLVLGIILFLNFISQDFFFRLDFSEDSQYTLSKATKDILKNLDSPVTIKAYFSENLPPEIMKIRKDFKELLIEYTNLSKGMLVYEFINPSEKDELEREAVQDGIQPLLINVREKDQMKQQKVFMGAIITQGTNKENIPALQPSSPIEYLLSTAIKKLTMTNKPSIGLLQGHGEPNVGEMMQAYQELSVQYSFEPLTLNDTAPIPERFKSIAIVAVKDSIPQRQFRQLDDFLAKGGRILVAINRVNGDLTKAYGSAVNNGLESWLSLKGIHVDDNFVIDKKCANVNVQQQQGMFRFMTQVAFPYIPIINKFANHPISKNLESVVMQFVSSVEYTGDSSKKFTPIAFSSDQSATLKPPLYFDVQKQWSDADFPRKNIVVAATLEGDIVGAVKSKMVIIGDGDFAINGPQSQGQKLNEDNVNLFVNSIDWLSDDTGLIELRTKGITSRPIKNLSDGTKTFLKYLNFLLPILLVIGYGIFRMQMNRNIRIKRMEENYG